MQIDFPEELPHLFMGHAPVRSHSADEAVESVSGRDAADVTEVTCVAVDIVDMC